MTCIGPIRSNMNHSGSKQCSVRIVLVVYNFRTIYFLFEGKAIPTESCRQRSFQILACYLSNRTDPHASIVLVDCTVDRQVGFSQVVI